MMAGETEGTVMEAVMEDDFAHTSSGHSNSFVLYGETFTKRFTRKDENGGGYEAYFDEKGRMCFGYNVWTDREGDVWAVAPDEDEAMIIAEKASISGSKALKAVLDDNLYNNTILEEETERMEGVLDDLDCERIELQRVADRLDAMEDARKAGLGKGDVALVAVKDGAKTAITTFPSIAAENVRTALTERGYELDGTRGFEIPCGFSNLQKPFESRFAKMDKGDLEKLLGRIESDCNRFLAEGFGYEGNLWAGDVEHQIAALRVAARNLPDSAVARTFDEVDIARLEDAMKLVREIEPKLGYETIEMLRPALTAIKQDCDVQGKPWLTKAELEVLYPPLQEVDLAEALKVKAAGYADRIGEDPVAYAMKVFDGTLPKAWIENNATVLQEFSQPEREGKTLLYAVKETDPEALALGYTAQVLVSTFDSKGEPSSPAIRFGSNFDEAYQYANPEIVEEASVSWTRDDCAWALQRQGVEPDEKTIDEMIDRVHSMDGWKDVAISHGNELLSDVAGEIAKERTAEGRSSKAEAHVMEEERERASARK